MRNSTRILQVKNSLENAGFECREFLLCPRQIGIPNSRLRWIFVHDYP